MFAQPRKIIFFILIFLWVTACGARVESVRNCEYQEDCELDEACYDSVCVALRECSKNILVNGYCLRQGLRYHQETE